MKIVIKFTLLLIITITIYFITPRDSDILLYIPKSNEYPSESLKLQNTPLTSYDYKILKLLDAQYGWVRVDNDSNNIYDIYNKILKNQREKSRTIVVYGGSNLSEILANISKQTNIPINRLITSYKQRAFYNEGEIVAKRYKIPYNASEDSIISYMILKSHNIFKELLKSENIDYTTIDFQRILTIASIIEKETQYYKEMPLISAVIYNRLKKNMKLQLDATLNYGNNTHKIVTHKLIATDISRYNTYRFPGLPPTPICSPSITAIKAALNPAKVKYLYFVKKGNKHTFSNSYNQHKLKVKAYKRRVKYFNKKRVTAILNSKIKYSIGIFLPNLYPSKISIPLNKTVQ